MTVQIVEILRPAEQGRSGPYVCRGEDGSTYFVKGRNTGRRSQITEWICAHLARELGLPLAPVEMVEIVPELLAETPKNMREVGAGLSFGSREYPQALWFELIRSAKPTFGYKEISSYSIGGCIIRIVFPAIRTCCGTRPGKSCWSLTTIWPSIRSSCPGSFLTIIYSGDKQTTFLRIWSSRPMYQDRLRNALAAWDTAVNSIPDTWWWVDDECTVATEFDIEAAHSLLQRCESGNFWGMA